MILIAAVILATVTRIAIGQYDPHTGEIIGMRGVHAILIIVFGLLLAIMYRVWWPSGKKAATGAAEVKSDSDFWKPPVGFEANSDLYLARSVQSRTLIEYQIKNKDGAVLWSGRCRLDKGGLRSIECYSGQATDDMNFGIVREKDGQGFRLTDRQSAVGAIRVTDKGLSFYDLDGLLAYSAVMEEINEDGLDVVIDWILTLETGRPLSRDYESRYFLLNKAGQGSLGKYFWALNNLDLTADIYNDLDRRVAVVFALFIDVQRWQSANKKRLSWKNLWGVMELFTVSKPGDVLLWLILGVGLLFFVVSKLVDWVVGKIIL